MIGLLIVTHGGLAQEFRNALEHVVGAQPALEAIAIGPDDDMEARRVDILEAVKRVDSGQGVIILTDMFGGTPSNLAISVMDELKAEVIAGISLPILVKLGEHPHRSTFGRGRYHGTRCRQEIHQGRKPRTFRRLRAWRNHA